MSNSLSQWKLLANVTRPVPNPALECSLFLMERKKELDVIERFNKFRLDHCNLALNWRRCGCFVYLYIEAIPIRSLMDGSFEWGESLVRPTNRLRFVRNVRTERFANLPFWSSSSLTSAVDFNERTSISVCRKWWPRGGWTCSLLGKKDRKEIREIPTESVQWLLKHFQLDLWWTVAGVFSMRLLKGRELHSLNESCSFCVCNMHREWFAILDIFLLLLLLFCFFFFFFLWRRRPARRFQWAYELRRLFNSKRSLSKRKKKSSDRPAVTKKTTQPTCRWMTRSNRYGAAKTRAKLGQDAIGSMQNIFASFLSLFFFLAIHFLYGTRSRVGCRPESQEKNDRLQRDVITQAERHRTDSVNQAFFGDETTRRAESPSFCHSDRLVCLIKPAYESITRRRGTMSNGATLALSVKPSKSQ